MLSHILEQIEVVKAQPAWQDCSWFKPGFPESTKRINASDPVGQAHPHTWVSSRLQTERVTKSIDIKLSMPLGVYTIASFRLNVRGESRTNSTVRLPIDRFVVKRAGVVYDLGIPRVVRGSYKIVNDSCDDLRDFESRAYVTAAEGLPEAAIAVFKHVGVLPLIQALMWISPMAKGGQRASLEDSRDRKSVV